MVVPQQPLPRIVFELQRLTALHRLRSQLALQRERHTQWLLTGFDSRRRREVEAMLEARRRVDIPFDDWGL